MKNIISCVLVVLVFLSACHDKEPKNKYANVKVCEVHASYFAMIDTADKGMLIQKFVFDGKGYVKEMLRYGMENEIIGCFQVSGKENPFPTSDDDSYHDTTVVYTTYNTNGKIVGQKVKDFNQNGLISKLVVTDNTGKVVSKNSYEYNNYNLIISDVYWDLDLDVPYQIIRYYYEYFNDRESLDKQ